VTKKTRFRHSPSSFGSQIFVNIQNETVFSYIFDMENFVEFELCIAIEAREIVDICK
jgi:hypothetical protein